ncbi:hypothetical protein BLOT_010085 [Blomia tropicalis]|nr:hypothetical protein BLOT_010085 [Blomia tropicalis]
MNETKLLQQLQLPNGSTLDDIENRYSFIVAEDFFRNYPENFMESNEIKQLKEVYMNLKMIYSQKYGFPLQPATKTMALPLTMEEIFCGATKIVTIYRKVGQKNEQKRIKITIPSRCYFSSFIKVKHCGDMFNSTSIAGDVDFVFIKVLQDNLKPTSIDQYDNPLDYDPYDLIHTASINYRQLLDSNFQLIVPTIDGVPIMIQLNESILVKPEIIIPERGVPYTSNFDSKRDFVVSVPLETIYCGENVGVEFHWQELPTVRRISKIPIYIKPGTPFGFKYTFWIECNTKGSKREFNFFIIEKSHPFFNRHPNNYDLYCILTHMPPNLADNYELISLSGKHIIIDFDNDYFMYRETTLTIIGEGLPKFDAPNTFGDLHIQVLRPDLETLANNSVDAQENCEIIEQNNNRAK